MSEDKNLGNSELNAADDLTNAPSGAAAGRIYR